MTAPLRAIDGGLAKPQAIKLGHVADHYAIDPVFEASIAALLCSSSRFFTTNKIGEEATTERFKAPQARLLVQAAKAVYAETKKAPGSCSIVFQRIRRMQHEGKVTWEAYVAACDYFEAAEARGLPDPVAALAQFKHLVVDELARKSAIEASGMIATRDPRQAMKMLRRLEAVHGDDREGLVEIGSGWDEVDEILEFRDLPRIAMGDPEIDGFLNGGAPIGQLCLFMGATNVGKGQALAHAGAEAAWREYFVCHATLEDPVALAKSRYIANLLGQPVDDVVKDPKRAVGTLRDRFPKLGRVRWQHFEEDFHTFDDVRAWVELEEQTAGREVDVLIVDMLEHLRPPSKAVEWEGKSYAANRAIFAQSASYALAEDDKRGHAGGPLLLWSASHVQRRSGKDRTSAPGTDDISDSMHKARIPGLLIGLVGQDEDRASGVDAAIKRHVAKHRFGRRGYTTEFEPHQFDCARLVVPTWR